MFNNKTGCKKVAVASLIFFSLSLAGFAQVLGDVDSKNLINIIDALKVAQYAVGLEVQGFEPLAADVNSDGPYFTR